MPPAKMDSTDTIAEMAAEMQALRLKLLDATHGQEEAERKQMEAEQGKEEEKRGREEAERQREEAERQREEADRQQEENNRQIRPTTLYEMLGFCHQFIDSKFVVETDPALTTRGKITDVKGKHYPHVLEPWEDFEELQAISFGIIQSLFHPADAEPIRAFKSRHFIEETGKTWIQKIASEPDLVSFQRPMVENFVRDVLSYLMPASDVTFDNTTHALGQNTDSQDPGSNPELDQDTSIAAASDQYPTRSKKLPPVPQPGGIDQICVFRDINGETELFMVEEYKAPHKVSKEALRAALHSRDSIHVGEIKDQETIPTDPDKNFLYNSKLLVCMAATQTYDYLIRGGCTHGCIVTGESIIFLRINEEDSTRLSYYLTEPFLDAAANVEFDYSKTVIARLTSFSLMAFESPPKDQKWIRDAKDIADKWIITEKLWKETPKKLQALMEKNDRKDTSYSPPKGLVPGDRLSPVKTRQFLKRLQSLGCKTPTKGFKYEQDDFDPDQQGHDDLATPTKPSSSKTCQGKQVQQSSRGSGAAGKQRQRKYCTQACLLGLAQRRTIDESCPNAGLHPRGKRGDTHSLTKPVLRQLLRQQLVRTMDEDCENLRLKGARGMLFKLSLAEHGYTFVGKATIDRFIPYLQHEGRVYHQLRKFQGQLIPVCLGNVDLEIPWFGIGVELVHMLLLSYGGKDLCCHPIEDQWQQAADFETIIAPFGVTHEDMRSNNMLWNEELRRVLFIDFELSTLKPQPRSPKSKASRTMSPKAKPAKLKTNAKTAKSKGLVKSRALQELSINQVSTLPKKSAAPTADAEKSLSPVKTTVLGVPPSKITGLGISPTKKTSASAQEAHDQESSIPDFIYI